MADRRDRPRKRRRPGYIIAARWAALWMVAFMLWMAIIPVLPYSLDPKGWWAAFVLGWWPLILVLYLVVELYETARRNATNQEGFIKDSGLALLGFLIGFAIFLLLAFRQGYSLTPDQFMLTLESTAVVGGDFFTGIVISQRIAFAGKERAETEES